MKAFQCVAGVVKVWGDRLGGPYLSIESVVDGIGPMRLLVTIPEGKTAPIVNALLAASMGNEPYAGDDLRADAGDPSQARKDARAHRYVMQRTPHPFTDTYGPNKTKRTDGRCNLCGYPESDPVHTRAAAPVAFVQVSVAPSKSGGHPYLYALDQRGRLWFGYGEPITWRPLVMPTEPEA